MTRRLQKVIAKLHRPLANRIRQVFALRDDAEKLPRLPSLTVISRPRQVSTDLRMCAPEFFRRPWHEKRAPMYSVLARIFMSAIVQP